MFNSAIKKPNRLASLLTDKNKLYFINSLVIAICLAGFFLRIFLFALDRSLWLDEAMLSVNIFNRSFLGLFQPLSLNQAAPIGFCLLQKAIVSILGNKDYALRIIPLLAGLVSLPIMYLVSKKYTGQLAGFFSLAVFALSSKPIFYSAEAKQYSTDALATLALLFIVPTFLEGQVKTRSFVILAVAGSVIIWISQPSCFVLAGIFITLALTYVLRRDTVYLYWLIGIGAAWGLSLGLNYLISLRYMASNNYLFNYWQGNFAPLPPWDHFSWYENTFTAMLKDPATLPVSAITLGLLVLGIFSFAVKRWQYLLISLTPFLLALCASAIRKYPLQGRLLLFLLPLLVLLLAEGINRFVTVLERINKPLAWLVYTALIVFFVRGQITVDHSNLKSPDMGEDIKPVLSYIRENYQSTDLIYVYYSAYPAFEFYAPAYGFDPKYDIDGIKSRNDPQKYLADVDQLKGNARVWFVFTHIFVGAVNEQNYMVYHLQKIGTKYAEYSSPGATVYLFNLEQIHSQTHPIH